MSENLKRDQLPPEQAENWIKNFEVEKHQTFNLSVSTIILKKDTYKILIGENENRVRIYLGIEPKKEDGKHVLCAFAISAFLLGSGDVYRDYETPVFKLNEQNEDYSSKIEKVKESIARYRSWRIGELDSEAEGALYRKYIYPNAYLLSKYELHEIFDIQEKHEAQISFGISKSMNAMVYPEAKKTRSFFPSTEMVFDFSSPCPPMCDESSGYNK